MSAIEEAEKFLNGGLTDSWQSDGAQAIRHLVAVVKEVRQEQRDLSAAVDGLDAAVDALREDAEDTSAALARAIDEIKALRMKLITAGAVAEKNGLPTLGRQLKAWGGIRREGFKMEDPDE